MTVLFFHPRQRTLVAFALGELQNRAGIARHLQHCSDCRQLVGFTQRLTVSLDSAPGAPPDALIERALASRAAGTRTILPSTTPGRPVTSPRLKVAGLLAVAVILAILSFPRSRNGEFRSANELLLAGLVPMRIETNLASRAAAPMTHRLHPLAATYQRRLVDSATGSFSDAGKFDLRVEAADSGMWLVTSAWREIAGRTDMQGARTWAESVTVAEPGFAPARRVVHVQPYRKWAGIAIHQGFRNDSVIGQMSLDADPTRRPIARDLRGERERLIASDALAPLYFMGATLQPGAEFDLGILGWAVVPNDVLLPVHMKVDGSERIVTPAGSFDCWRFTVRVGGEIHSHWVRQSDHLGVLTRRRMSNGATRELILIHEESR